jgi:hypothetical protein
MVSRFPGPIPGIVVLTAAPIFPVIFDYDLLKIGYEDLPVISHEGFQHFGFSEIEVCPRWCSFFGRWQWHLFDFVIVDVLDC